MFNGLVKYCGTPFLKDVRFYYSFAVLIASLFYYLSYANYGFIQSDWGMIVVAAERFLRGEVFYRDFSIIYTPGTYIYTALAFKLFGVSLSSATLGWSILRAFNCLLIYLIGIEFVSRKAALILPLLLWLVPGTLHKVFFVFFGLLNILFLIKMFSSKSKVFYFVLGIVASLTLFFRIDLAGIFFITFLFIELLKIIWSGERIFFKPQIVKALKNIFFFGSGAIAGVAPFALYLFSNSAIKEAYRQTIKYTASMRSLWFDLPPINEIFSFNMLAIYKYLGISLPFAFYFFIFAIIISIIITKSFNEKDKRLLILILYGCMTLNQAISYPGLTRVGQILFPILIANVYLFIRYYNSPKHSYPRRTRLLYSASLTGLNLVLLCFIILSCVIRDVYINGSIFIRFRDTTFMSDPRLKVYATYKEEVEEFNRIKDIIKTSTKEDEYIFTFPYTLHMYHFVTGRKTLEKYNTIGEYLKSEEMQEEVIKLLEKKKVRVIIADLAENRMRKWVPILDKYIQEHYEAMSTTGTRSLLVRKS